MSKFTEAQLRAYIEKLSDEHGLGITISEAPIRLEYRHFNFKGRIKGARGEKVIAVPFESSQYGVITARSVLYGTRASDLKWLVNGQASGPRTGEAACFVGRNPPLSLHISKAQLKEFTHANLENAPEDKKASWKQHFDQDYEYRTRNGEYAEAASFGRYVSDDGDFLTLRLEPILIVTNDSEPEVETTLKM